RRDRYKLLFVVTIPNQPVQRTNTRNRERRRTSESRASRHTAFRHQMKARRRFEKVDQLRHELEPFFLQQVFNRRERRLERNFPIARLEHDATIVTRLYAAARVK